MKVPVANEIFNVRKENFETTALDIFRYQLGYNTIYKQYCDHLSIDPAEIRGLEQIPFLPISFFKTHPVATFESGAEKIFYSSGTSGMGTSRHLVKSLAFYERSFIDGFKKFYGNPGQFAFLCLLPSYLEREGSSLIYMAERLVQLSGNPDSGFFLNAAGTLTDILIRRSEQYQLTILLGVTYALLDFAADAKLQLANTIIMETGGMKGRRNELTRAEVHEQLKNAFGVPAIHSEYGMTELLSQAYSKDNGLFYCPPWMKVLVREEDDPFNIKTTGSGLLCIADLANACSCSFIETADAGRVFEDGSFEVLGRMDNSDIRGCSLLVL